MKTHGWLCTTAALIVCAGWVLADAPAPPHDMKHVVDRPSLIIDELTGLDVAEASLRILLVLEEIEASDLSLEEILERIAEAVGCAVYALSEASPEVMRDLSPNIREDRLSVVTASAVLASREHANPIMESLLSGRVQPQERAAIQAAAAEPDRHLSRTELQRAVRCVPAVRPLPVRPEPIRPLPEDPERTDAERAPRSAPVPAPRYDGQ